MVFPVIRTEKEPGIPRTLVVGGCQVEWLEMKISKLSLCDKTQKNELLEAFLKHADGRGNIVLIENEKKIIEDFNK